MPARTNGTHWAVLAGACIAGLLVGAVLSQMQSSGMAEPIIPADTPADERIQYVTNLQPEDEHIYAMRWSADGNLWFVGSRSDGRLELHRYSPATDGHDHWLLPGTASPGPHTYLAETGDGTWWVAANYTLWHFDATSGEAVAFVTLDRQHPLQTAAADDPGAPLPGTWINGLLLSGDDVLITRHNVRALFSVGADGTPGILRELEDAPAGLVSANGEAIAYASMEEVLDATGHPAGLTNGAGVAFAEAAGCRIALDPASGKAVVVADSSVHEVQGLVVQPGDLAAVSGDGEIFTAALNEGSAIIRGSCATGQVEPFQLPIEFVSTQDPTLRGGYQLAQLDKEFVALKTTIMALAVGPSGQVAFSDDAMRVAIIQ